MCVCVCTRRSVCVCASVRLHTRARARFPLPQRGRFVCEQHDVDGEATDPTDRRIDVW